MKRIFFFVAFIALTGCTNYSTITRPQSENTINAPIDIVWEKTLQVLPKEDITIKMADKTSHSILGRKGMTIWSLGDDMTIQLISNGEHQTIMNFSSETKNLLIGWGHEERAVLGIFNKVKEASEK